MNPLVIAIIPDPAANSGIQMLELADQTPGATWDGATICTGEEQSDESDITDNPVEVGIAFSDNSRPKPAEVTYTVSQVVLPSDIASSRGLVSPLVLDVPKTPLKLALGSLISAGVSALGDLIFGAPPAPRVNVVDFVDYDPARELYAALTALKDAAVACTVITSIRTLESMLIKSVKYAKKTQGSSEITVSFKQVFTVSSQTVEAPRPLEPRGQPKASAGQQSPTPATPEKKNTLLAQITGTGK